MMILEREPETEFEEVGILFIATFIRKPAKQVISEKNGGTTQKTTQKILELITANPTISRKELAAQIGITYNLYEVETICIYRDLESISGFE
jgi:predicted HTH transcriptional regulator